MFSTVLVNVIADKNSSCVLWVISSKWYDNLYSFLKITAGKHLKLLRKCSVVAYSMIPNDKEFDQTVVKKKMFGKKIKCRYIVSSVDSETGLDKL